MGVRIEKVDLPGIGTRHDVVTEQGRRIGVVTRRSGERQLAMYDEADPDSSRDSVRLSEDEAVALALAGVTWISSSAVIAKMLRDLGRLGNRETPTILSILVIEDLAMEFSLPVLSALVIGAGLLAGATALVIAPDPADIVSVLVPAVVLAVLTMATKTASGYLAARDAGIGVPGRWRTGLTLTPQGEFSSSSYQAGTVSATNSRTIGTTCSP